MTKTKKRAVLADAVSFAHLLPLTPGASARAEEDDDDQDKDRTGAEDDDEDDKKPASKKAKKAKADDGDGKDDEDDGADADEGDDEDVDAEDDDKKPAGRKAGKAKADDGDDDDGDDDASARAGAMRERARCAAIFGSRHAAGRPDLAAHLAFSTNMSAREAIGTMKTLVGGQTAGARTSLADRMRAESVPNPGQGGSATPTGAKGLAAAMMAASKKAQGG